MGWTFYDSSGRKLNTASTLIDNLDIDGATDIGAAIVDADLFIIDDGAGGTNRKTAASRIVTYVGANAAASQAEMEAASSNTVFATPGRTQNHPGVAKAWIQVPADGVVTPSAANSYNVASVTDNGTGQRTVVADTDFSNTTYCALSSAGDDSDLSLRTADYATGSWQFIIYKGTTLTDKLCASAAFGDQ
jgi:hypothetical protein